MLELSLIDVLLLASGVLAVVVIALSRVLRRLPASEPLLALVAGVLLGPQVLGALEVAPLTQEWEHLHAASRLLLALSVMAVALRYPAGHLRRHWRPVAVLLIVVMPLMALATAALSAAVLGLGLGTALLLGAALAPTDPVLASSVVTGQPARDHVARARPGGAVCRVGRERRSGSPAGAGRAGSRGTDDRERRRDGDDLLRGRRRRARRRLRLARSTRPGVGREPPRGRAHADAAVHGVAAVDGAVSVGADLVPRARKQRERLSRLRKSASSVDTVGVAAHARDIRMRSARCCL